ncbi:MAG: hypothetical protein JRH20_21555 [Deltaproteobacteria bacterium]|nr:hypothetical protein [Deltaproteobacteria bacterium]
MGRLDGGPEPLLFSLMQHPILFTLTLLLATSCGRPTVEGPQRTLRQYVAAVRANHPQLAYNLLSPQTQRQVPREEFMDRWRKSRLERLQQAQEIEASLDHGGLQVSAKVTLHKGKTRLMRFEEGWKLTGDFRATATRSPRGVVLALLAAAERRDYRAVKALMSPRVARAFERELENRIKALRSGLQRGIRVKGNRASLNYGRFKLQLVEKNGRWMVSDFD